MARGFDSFASLFHTVFNRIVENCHDAFIFLTQQSELMANKLLATTQKLPLTRKWSFEISYPRRDNISFCLDLPTNLDEASNSQRR
jgi:hypothetical protein